MADAPPQITMDDLAVAIQNLQKLIDNFGDMITDWCNGVAGGGPNGDGTYPLPTSLGSCRLAKCVDQLAADSQKMIVANGGTIQVGQTPGYNTEGNFQYTFKPSDSGKLFIMLSNAGGSNDILLLLPDNLPAGWNVAVIQYADNRLRFRKANDLTNTTNSNLRNGQNAFATANKGALAVAVCESINSAKANNFFSIAGAVAA
ncbi:hypothetical protein [Sphingomonas sp. BAUL-RG-20F-R05-02]|uniref:hypothetical protein n=1 Tax=Sphingomonas sp. BAUL-RG-20F-R05-02 TaxID=2914830 RepID=UPI001F59F85D|nr:hypothetical protein [Sphingomonas sp. BAUL-RG-20F-R05-02]